MRVIPCSLLEVVGVECALSVGDVGLILAFLERDPWDDTLSCEIEIDDVLGDL